MRNKFASFIQEEESVVLPEPTDGAGSGSLNAGFELDDELAIPDEYTEGVAPDFNEADSAMQALEQQFIDLRYLADALERTGGMTQDFALEAQKLLPNFGGGVPIGYYTPSPTLTRYRVALEEIDKGMWGLIAAGVAAVLALIWKIWKWLRGDKEQGNGGAANGKQAEAAVDKKVEQLEKIPDALSNTADTIKEADSIIAKANLVLKDATGREFKVTSLQQIIDKLFTDDTRYSRYKMFLESRDPFFHDIINHGAYSRAIVDFGKQLHSVTEAFDSAVELLEDVRKRDRGSYDRATMKANIRDMENVSTRRIKITVDGKTMTLLEAHQHLAQMRAKMMDSAVTKPIVFDKLFDTMYQAFKKSDSDIVYVLKNYKLALQRVYWLEDRLEKIRKMIDNFANDGNAGGNTEDIAEFLRQTIQVVGSDLSGFGFLGHQVMEYAKKMAYLAEQAIGMATEIIDKTATQMRNSGQQVPKDWAKVQKDLRIHKQAVTEAFYGIKI